MEDNLEDYETGSFIPTSSQLEKMGETLKYYKSPWYKPWKKKRPVPWYYTRTLAQSIPINYYDTQCFKNNHELMLRN